MTNGDIAPPLKDFIRIDDTSIQSLVNERAGVLLCPPHFIDDASSNFPSISEIVNESSAETGCSIPKEKMDAFDDAYLNEMKLRFQKEGYYDELNEVLTSNKSNGRRMKLQVMVLPPGLHFSIHAHPNLEFELTMFGTLREFRWLSFRVPASELQYSNDPDVVTGPDIAATHLFEEQYVAAGETLINETGSVHQSFTAKDEGCVILVLWSGVHAKTPPSKVFNKDERLDPNAGWGD